MVLLISGAQGCADCVCLLRVCGVCMCVCACVLQCQHWLLVIWAPWYCTFGFVASLVSAQHQWWLLRQQGTSLLLNP